MRRTWAIALVALVCVTGCADAEPSASGAAYDDEPTVPAARETVLPESADASVPAAPDSATTAADAGAQVIVPVSAPTAADAHVAQAAPAPDAGAATAPTTQDAGSTVVVTPPLHEVLGIQAVYNGHPIRIRNVTGTFYWQITIHAWTNAQGWPDSFDVVDMLTGKTLAPGKGGLDNSNTGTVDNTWTGLTDTWQISLRFERNGTLRESVIAERRQTSEVLIDADAPIAYWVR